MRKFSLYFACFLTLALMSCGDTSGDPTARIALEADITAVTPGSSAVITATVTKAVGKTADPAAEAVVVEPGWGENVTFRLLTANGAQLSTPLQKTDGDGKARAVYTAGNNYNSDTVHAALDNGMSATITITKTGGIVGARIASLEVSLATVAQGQTSVITATVTNGDSTQPMSGEAVTFNIPANDSGAAFINAAGASVPSIIVSTDANGRAVAVYRAGGVRSTEEVYDNVRATLSNGSSNAVVITRSAGPAGAVLTTLTASPDYLNGGQTSVITATVIGGTSSGANESVTLTLPVNNSGGSFINAAGASVSTVTITTGSGGTASAIYKAGASQGSAVQDTVLGTLSNGDVNAVTITVNPDLTVYNIYLTPSPSKLLLNTDVSLLTAYVSDFSGIPVRGVPVVFERTIGSGTLGNSPVTTDGAGNAVTTYTGPGTGPGSAVIKATVTIGGTPYIGFAVITYP